MEGRDRNREKKLSLKVFSFFSLKDFESQKESARRNGGGAAGLGKKD
jgi:hypothetical protein